ncbi:MAG: hypothetical protein ACM3SS_08145 [Rhodospirillaceae bacterium]
MKRFVAIVLLGQLCTPASASESLGRLFFTPDQRSQLDALRKQRAHRPAIETAVEAAPPPPEVVRYSGLVRRSDGRTTVWINDRPVHERTKDPGAPTARVDDDGAARIAITRQRDGIRLKVGQSADLTTGEISESYARRPPLPVAEAPSSPHPGEPGFRLRRKYDNERGVLAPDSMP